MEQKLLNKVLGQIKHGSLQVTFPDGTRQTYGQGQPKVSVTVHDKRLLRKLSKGVAIAFGEAYMHGGIEVNSPLEDLLELAQRNPLKLQGLGRWGRLPRPNKNVKSKQAGYIARHYDRGNDFYKLWLDETMNYSCAYFHKPSDSLETAQRQKTEHILRKLQLKPGMSLLDIGCGWGFFLIEAAKRYRVKGYGVSLSKEQITLAKQRAKEAKVDHMVTFEYRNYLDIPISKVFDRVVSVGFFEHVGRGNLADYFAAVKRHLKPDGISVLHAITHRTETPIDPWIDKYIFPGGYIPSMRETTALMAEADFTLFDYENLGQHYAMTLAKWLQAYERHKKQVIAMYDETFYRIWRLYLIGAMMTFKTGSSALSQWVFKNGQDPTWPLTREFLYK